MMAILDFRMERFLSTSHTNASYQVSDGLHGSHLGFLIGMILAILDLQVTPMLPTKFQVIWPLGSGEEAKNRFSIWLHLGFPIRMILALFDLPVTLMRPTNSCQLAFQFRKRSKK